jgi:ABC-type phosphate transport system auxiliary subunit
MDLGKAFSRGDHLVWLTGSALGISLLMILGLLAVILTNGLGIFWPSPIEQVTLRDGSVFAGEPMQRQAIPNPGQADHLQKFRLQLKVGNRDLYGFDFKWFDEADVAKREQPQGLYLVERSEYGPLIGAPVRVLEGDKEVASGPAAAEALSGLVEKGERDRREVKALEKDEIGSVNYDIERIRLQRRKLDYREKQGGKSDFSAERRSPPPLLDVSPVRAESPDLRDGREHRVAARLEPLDKRIQHHAFQTEEHDIVRLPTVRCRGRDDADDVPALVLNDPAGIQEGPGAFFQDQFQPRLLGLDAHHLHEGTQDVGLGDDPDERHSPEDRQAADAMREHQAGGRLDGHLRRRSHDLGGHDITDLDLLQQVVQFVDLEAGGGRRRGLAYVAVGDDPDQSPPLHHGQMTNPALADEVHGVPERIQGPDRDRVGFHPPLDKHGPLRGYGPPRCRVKALRPGRNQAAA